MTFYVRSVGRDEVKIVVNSGKLSTRESDLNIFVLEDQHWFTAPVLYLILVLLPYSIYLPEQSTTSAPQNHMTDTYELRKIRISETLKLRITLSGSA